MPRRRPSALRGIVPVRTLRPRRYPSIDRLSGSCAADVRRLEHTRFWPEATAEAFHLWKTLAHGPLRRLIAPFAPHGHIVLDCCDPMDARDHLEAVLHILPRKSARELRALVWALDEKILTRAKVIRADSRDVPWWRDHG